MENILKVLAGIFLIIIGLCIAGVGIVIAYGVVSGIITGLICFIVLLFGASITVSNAIALWFGMCILIFVFEVVIGSGKLDDSNDYRDDDFDD